MRPANSFVRRILQVTPLNIQIYPENQEGVPPGRERWGVRILKISVLRIHPRLSVAAFVVSDSASISVDQRPIGFLRHQKPKAASPVISSVKFPVKNRPQNSQVTWAYFPDSKGPQEILKANNHHDHNELLMARMPHPHFAGAGARATNPASRKPRPAFPRYTFPFVLTQLCCIAACGRRKRGPHGHGHSYSISCP